MFQSVRIERSRDTGRRRAGSLCLDFAQCERLRGARLKNKGLTSPMRIDLIPAGDSPPDSLNVLIEVPIGGEPVKYEFDKASGALFVDRFLHPPMSYPANYGFVPNTLGEDGDPLEDRKSTRRNSSH